MSTLGLTGPMEEDPSDPQRSDGPDLDDSVGSRGEQPKESQHQRHQSSRHQPGATQKNSRRKQSANRHIPARRDVMATLARLPQLVAAGLLTPAQSNAMHSSLRTLLDNLPTETARSAGNQVDPASLRSAVRQTPELLDLIAPLLSDEQLRELLEDGDEDDDDQKD